MRKKETIIMLGFPLIFLGVLLTVVLLKLNKSSSPSVFVPFSLLSPTPFVEVSTRWATDSGLLEIENEFKSLKNQLDFLNLEETSFFPPQLEFGLGINP